MVQQGIDSLMITEIKQILYRNYQIDMNAKRIQELTFEELIALENKEDNPLLSLNSEIIDESQIATSKEFSFLTPEDAVLKLNKNADGTKNVFFLHTLEGHVMQMKPLAEMLKAAVYGLQCSKECSFDMMYDFAVLYEKLIRKIQPKGPYMLCGYSYGSILSIEIGIILEKSGDKVTIVSVDGSPAQTKNLIETSKKINEISTEQAHYYVLSTFSSGFPAADPKQVDKK